MIALTGGSVDFDIQTDITGYESLAGTQSLAIDPAVFDSQKVSHRVDGPTVGGLAFGSVYFGAYRYGADGMPHANMDNEALRLSLACNGAAHDFAGPVTKQTTLLSISGYLDFTLDAAATLNFEAREGENGATFEIDDVAITPVAQSLSPLWTAAVALAAGSHRLEFALTNNQPTKLSSVVWFKL